MANVPGQYLGGINDSTLTGALGPAVHTHSDRIQFPIPPLLFPGTIGKIDPSVNRQGGVLQLDSRPPDDTTPPVVRNLVPPPGTILTTDIIQFDVSDPEPIVNRVFVWIKFVGDDDACLVHDGTTFSSKFIAGSVRAALVSGGYHFTLQYDGGWPSSIQALTVKAVDQAGNFMD